MSGKTFLERLGLLSLDARLGNADKYQLSPSGARGRNSSPVDPPVPESSFLLFQRQAHRLLFVFTLGKDVVASLMSDKMT